MRSIAIGLMLLLGCLTAYADSLSAAEKSAEKLMQQHQQQIDSPEAVNTNLMEPLTTDKKMQTFDGKQQFSAKIQPKAGKELLKLTLQPLPSGDVKILSIAQDMKLSGKLDSYSPPNWIISGVCANGFICCDPGSWNSCQAFAWTTDNNKRLAIEKVPLSSLGGCYCINSSCGTGLAWSNLNDVLSHLGGGAVGAIVQKNPLYSLGAPKITDTTVTYYAQNNEDSSVNLTELPNMAEPQRVLGYAANPQKMEDDKASQAKNDTIWKLIKESQANEASQSFVDCRIDRMIEAYSPNAENILKKVSGPAILEKVNNNLFKLDIKYLNQYYLLNKLSLKDETILEILISGRIKNIKLGYLYLSAAYLDLFINDSFSFSDKHLSIEGSRWSEKSPMIELTGFQKEEKYLKFRYNFGANPAKRENGELYDWLCVANYPTIHAQIFIEVDVSDELKPERIINGCTAYENDKSYLLVDESIDRVNTFKNYVKTGLRPVKQTRTINGPHTAFQVTRDWFLKERRYLHKDKAPQKYEFDFERTNYIQKHSTERQYHDQYKHNGQVINSQGDLFSTDAKPYAACTLSCKTKKARPQNDVSGDAGSFNVTGEKQRDPVTYDFFYRPCKNGVCPLEPGEILVKECQCLEEFGEAAAMMQVLRMAGNDLICSSGATKTLGVPPSPPQKSTTPNWVCSKGQEEDGVARLTNCQADQHGAQLCPIDAVPCKEESYEVEEDKTVDVVRVIPGRWETPLKGMEGFMDRVSPIWEMLGFCKWIPEQRVTEKQTVKIKTPKQKYSCPLGSQYPCITPAGSTIAMCTPNQCIDLAKEQAIRTDVIDGGTLDDDGRRRASGECLDQLYLFNGASGYCRTAGTQTAFKNCCKNQGKVVSDNTGASTEMKMVSGALPTLFKAGKAAYQGYQACTAATVAAKAQAGAAAAKGTLLVGFDPATIAASVAIGFVVSYLSSPCSESDMNTALTNASGFCVEVGEYCREKWPIVGCVQRAKSFCCFNSKMARIIQQQGRRQLKIFNGFGSAKHPECRGFTPEEFQSLDFSKIDLSEYFGDLHRTLLPEMQRNMESKLSEYQQQTHH